ncbi:Myosin regulatory light chain, smooth muscle [Candida viswanathii]|uniref:Myosin regulatory light chain, smooth muscle n=1 Tax=Candida viswanathii TaxID=5486 RepID=A0A367YIV5_9ASCO|nr:Myosin regulatory light chain, smooth muscle [Candida viswanathii]
MLLHLTSLSASQKAQLRNAFTLIDGESRDSSITKDDLVKLYSTLGIRAPSDTQLREMLTIDGVDKSESGVNFTQFLNLMARELLKFEDRSIIYNALKIYLDKEDLKTFKDELQIDVNKLKDACCSVQLGEIGSGDQRLSRANFDKLVEGFVQEQMDGKQIFLASKWIDAYID